jgi:hypothetical protein
MRNTTQNRTAPWLSGRLSLAVAVILIAATSPAVFAGERGRCITTFVSWPIILPDESKQPPGSLTVCMERKITGVSGLHEVRVGGFPIGMFMSRIGKAEGPANGSVAIVFESNSLNEHRLIGYTVADGSTLRTYALYDPRTLRRQGRSMRIATLDLSDESSVWIAAGGEKPRPLAD